MATIADNIRSMAELVAEVKRNYRLTENTVLRIVDMNFALAQNTGAQTFSGDEPFPMPEGVEGDDVAEGQLMMFPDTEPVEGAEDELGEVAPEELGGEA